MTDFVGISFGAISSDVCVIATSTGLAITKAGAMTAREVIAALLAIRQQAGKGKTFITYDAAVDFELIFSKLSKIEKNLLFGLWRAQEDKLQSEGNPLAASNWSRRADAIYLDGVRVSYLSGKVCRISHKKQSLALYDIVGYFTDSIDSAARAYLSVEDAASISRIERSDLELWQAGLKQQVIDRCVNEARIAVKLAERIDETIRPLALNVKQWYGPSAIASRCLSRWKARRQGKRLTDGNAAYELLRAIDCAYFGGRVEAVKLGTIQNVQVFDLNSAYAYATTLLSQFARPLRFSRDAGELNVPFSIWYCEYELPADTAIGVLPTRAPRGSISFRRQGKGYFWQPELEYLFRKYPNCYRVKWGYVARDAKPITFKDDIYAMYDYRNKLKANGDAGQQIIKLALANLYGKFAQNTGGAFYQCRAWAGWITSYVRRLLLDAVDGIEDQIVCFAQDAIHVDGGVSVDVKTGNGLGEWKQSSYASGLYLAPGIYELHQTGAEKKTASRGATGDLDFERIARQLSERQASEIERAFFVGYALASSAAVKYGADYLKDVSEQLQLVPGRLRSRNYETKFDWLRESRTSKINQSFSGSMSARYFPQEQSTTLRLRLKDRGFT